MDNLEKLNILNEQLMNILPVQQRICLSVRSIPIRLMESVSRKSDDRVGSSLDAL